MSKIINYFIMTVMMMSIILISCSKKESNIINIGVIIPLTGPSAQYGKYQKNGAEIAQEEINSKDLVKINLIFEDSQSKPKFAVSIFNKLASGNNLCAITGVSGVVLAIAPAADKLKFPQINTSGQNPNIGNTGKYTISLINLANVETAKMAKYTYEVLKIKKVAIIYSNAAAGTGAAIQFEKSFQKLGGNIVDMEGYDDSQTDFNSYIIKIFSKKPDAVFAPGVSMNISRDRKSTRLNSSHIPLSRMPSSA